MKVVFCASEAVPFAKTGGLADVCGALPQEIAELGHEVIVILPEYRSVLQSAVLKPLDRDFDYAQPAKNVRVYFVKHDMYLREGLYGDHVSDYPDNLRRFAYFCSKSLELFSRINFYPDIVHCHDWQTALIPLYLKDRSREYVPAPHPCPKTVLTVHNVSYQGIFPKEAMPETGLGWEYFSLSGLEFYDQVNLIKGGILFADMVNTVSPTHCCEMQMKEFGCGLDGVLRERRGNFEGILNGVDYRIWNPQGDPHIAKRYSASRPDDKHFNKENLQESCGLARNGRFFLAGFVGRLVEQKGIDLLINVLPHMAENRMQAAILGSGDVKYENILSGLAQQYPSALFFSSRFDDALAHRIYAGADIFLMPSRFEPCGIGQMIGFKYGTVPVVHKTGGLADTVYDYQLNDHAGTGFVASEYNGGAFLLAVRRARELFADCEKWRHLTQRLMRLNLSWRESAKKYTALYEKALAHR